MSAFKIFKTDFKRIIKNPAAITIILGLCIIPSFYTWITLKANWNPYVDTGNVPIAVVNEDVGTIVNNKIVNFGDQTVQQLNQNDSMKWTVVGSKVAEQGLKDGQYYAEIIIPSNFSQDLETVYTGNPIKPDLIYKVNEKTNAIAAKISDLAVSQLQGQIKKTFFDSVNKVILNEGNSLGRNIKENQPMILNVKNVIANTNSNVSNIIDNINSSSDSVSNLSSYISTLKNNLPAITSQIDKLQGVVGSSKYLIESTQSNISNIEGNLNSTNQSMQSTNSVLNTTVNDLRNTVSTQKTIDTNALNAANTAQNQLNNSTNKVVDKTKTVDTNVANDVKNNPDTTKVKQDTQKTADAKPTDSSVKKDINNINNNSNVKKDINGIDNNSGVKKDINNINSDSSTNKDINNVKQDVSKAIDNNKEAYLSKEQIANDKAQVMKALESTKNLSSLIGEESQLMNMLNQIDGNTSLNGLINQLNQLQSAVQNETNELNGVNNTLSNQNNVTASEIDTKLNEVSALSNETSQLFSSFTNEYSSNINPSMASISNSLTQSLNNIDGILLASKEMVPELNQIAKVGISSSNLTVSNAEELKGKLQTLEKTLTKLQTNTEKINNESLNNLVNLLDKNPTELASMLSSPVSINVQELYGMSIFGIGLAPFYTVLSIWVGALLCTTVLRANDEEREDGTKKTILGIHFGKLLMFLSINLIQGTIVTLGDVWLIGIKPANFWLLLGFAWLSCIVFTVIVFTLVSLNGNFGKAGALVLMVIQVAGAGAIYPIEVNPVIFQKLEFLWPFTYAIDGFRQAIGGPDWTQVRYDFIALIIFLVIFLLLGMSKVFEYKFTDYIEDAFRESDL